MESTAAKDAPIVAADLRAGVDYLVSPDRQHMVGVPIIADRSRPEILLPGELLRACGGAPSQGTTDR